MSQAALLLSAFLAAAPARAQAGHAPAGATSVPRAPLVPRFDLTPAEMRRAYVSARVDLRSALAVVSALPPGDVTFANTVRALEDAEAAFSERVGPLGFLSSVAVDPEVRAAAAEIALAFFREKRTLYSDEGAYRAVQAVVARSEALEARDARLLKETLDAFRDNGMALSPTEREKLRAARARLSDLELDFERNIAEHSDWLELERADLDGLPEAYISGLARTPEGKFKVTLDYPTYFPFMERARSSEARRKLEAKFADRAGEVNTPLIAEMLMLRARVARLLGFSDFTRLALRDLMAGAPDVVERFLEKLKGVVAARARDDLLELLQAKRRVEPSADTVHAWERLYYADTIRRRKYDVDQELVRQYFPEGRVVGGTLRVYERLLGVRFSEAAGPAWHPDARLYEVSDAASGRRLGRFYLDLHPREGKYTHAAVETLVSGRLMPDGTYREPVAAMVANFPKPTPGAPALLAHGEVLDFLHEFGHVMHVVLTEARDASLSGFEVAMDFVEAPSQLMENFIWSPEVLAEVSGHWKDGTPLPDELRRRLEAARGFQSGLNYAGWIAIAALDQAFHAAVPDDVAAAFNQAYSAATGIPVTPGTRPVASLPHMTGGYEAAFYSYLWAEVFSDDLYTRFLDRPLDPAVGAQFRREILSRGAERPEIDSLRAFLGREPSEDAFLARLSRGARGRARWWKPWTWFRA